MKRGIASSIALFAVVAAYLPLGAATAGPDFGVSIENYERCGWTCGDVTVAFKNDGGTALHDTMGEAYARAGDSLVWSGRVEIGDLAPGEVYTVSQRVDVGFWNAMRIRLNGGRIEYRVVLKSDEVTQVFGDRVKVT